MPELQRMLGACSIDQFANDYLEKKHLHVKSGYDRESIDRFFSIGAVEGLFRLVPLAVGKYQVIKTGFVESEPDLHPSGGIDPRYIIQEYNSGATLRVNDVQHSVPAVAEVCKRLANECMCAVFANAYVTPAGNPGFNPHYDDHDVLILQTHGSKVWSIHDVYANRKELPLLGSKYNVKDYTPGPPTETFRMEVGDILYIPRGHMHSATCDDTSPSIHLTFSLNWICWNELAFHVIAQSSIQKKQLRESILAAILNDRIASENRPEWIREHLTHLVYDALRSTDANDAFRTIAGLQVSEFFDLETPDLTSSLSASCEGDAK